MSSPELRFHHLGYACRDILFESTQFSALGYENEGAIFEDHLQGVTGLFMTGAGPRIELLSPLPDIKVLDAYLASPARIYHFAFETDDIEAALSFMVAERRGKVTRPPVPSVAFNGRRIAFFMLPNMSLTELIEA